MSETNLPIDLYDRVNDPLATGCSASLPIFSCYVPLVAMHFAAIEFGRNLARRWPRRDGKLDMPSDLDLKSCSSYFDLRIRSDRRECLRCGTRQVTPIHVSIREDWSPDDLAWDEIAREDFARMVEFGRAHRACQPQ